MVVSANGKVPVDAAAAPELSRLCSDLTQPTAVDVEATPLRPDGLNLERYPLFKCPANGMPS